VLKRGGGAVANSHVFNSDLVSLAEALFPAKSLFNRDPQGMLSTFRGMVLHHVRPSLPLCLSMAEVLFQVQNLSCQKRSIRHAKHLFEGMILHHVKI